MTIIHKNFDLAGLSADVQFGKSGGRILYANGVFQIADAAASALVRVQVANGTATSDAVSKSQLDSVQSELDTVEAAVGLRANGTIPAWNSPIYVGNSTTIANAVEVLDHQLKTTSDNVAATSAALSSLTLDTIKSNDTLSAVKAANTGVEIYGNVSGVKTLLMDVKSASISNSSPLRLDFTQPNKTIISTQGSNSTLVLMPKGTGVIDHAGSRAANVANGVADTDAIALGQANSIFSRYLTGVFVENNTTQAMGAINGIIVRVIVQISSAFNSGASVTVGYTGNTSALSGSSEIDPTTVGIYVIDRVLQVNNAINAYVSGSTGSGNGRVIVEYLKV